MVYICIWCSLFIVWMILMGESTDWLVGGGFKPPRNRVVGARVRRQAHLGNFDEK